MNPKQRIEIFAEEAEKFIGKNLTSDNPSFIAWNNALIRFSEKMYGEESFITKEFRNRLYTLGFYTLGTPEIEFVKAFENDIKITIEDLKRLLNELDDDIYIKKDNQNDYKIKEVQPIQVNVTNNNNNNMNVLNNMSYQEIRNEINENTYLDDKIKIELLEKLTEIWNLHNSTETKIKKWTKAKSLLSFVLDKGADIAIMFIPKIIEAIVSGG